MPSIKNIFMSIVMASAMTSAHMIMKTPTPYGSPDSSPLDPSGSNFPCKATSNAGATVNQMAIGAPQTLSFTGSAVHGGGSCQVSLTKDMPATKSSKWMVIHSIEGGCPAKNAGGNLPDGSSADTYTFTVPDGIAPGAYTLAWTWFNKIGNREMYMNCASVQVTAGSKKREVHHPHHKCANESIAVPELDQRDTSFPDLFVANIPTSNCVNTETFDTQFPNPGSSVDKFGQPNVLKAPSGPQCSAGPAAAGGAGGASSGASSGAGAGAGAGSGAGAGAGTAASSGAGAGAAAGAGAGSGAGAGAGAGSSAAASSPAAAAASSPAAGDASGSGGASPSSAPAAAAPSAQASAAVSAAAGAPAAASSAPFANASDSGAGGAAAATPATGASPSVSPSGGSAPAAGGSSTGSCTTAGASICSPDGKQIGTCTPGMTVTWIPVADGTECKGGMMVMAGSKMLKSRSGRLLRWAF